MDIRRAARNLLPAMIATRRDLHRHPEMGWTEYRTASLVAQRLTPWASKYSSDGR